MSTSDDIVKIVELGAELNFLRGENKVLRERLTTPQSPADQFFTHLLKGEVVFQDVPIGQRQNDLHPEWCVVIQPKEV